ncbi:MAG: ABC transporter permease [Bryobacteraceae bacterium]
MRIALALCVIFLLLAPFVLHEDPLAQDRGEILAAPTAVHWFGTDDYGRDLWARFLHGGRWSLGVGISATALCLSLAWIIGTAAAMFPAWGAVLMWVADLFLCLPWLYLLIAARAALPLELDPRAAFATLLLLLALTGWARPARLVRGRVLEVKQRGYVQAAIGFGVPRARVFVRHILPATGDLLAAQIMILLPRFVLAELTLTFLGAGAADPWPSWGGLIAPLKQVYLIGPQWWRLLPMLAMIPFFALAAIASRAWESRFRLVR